MEARGEFKKALDICKEYKFNPGLPMIVHYRGESEEVKLCVWAILEIRYKYMTEKKMAETEEKMIYKTIDSYYRMGKSVIESTAYALYSLDFSRSMINMPTPDQISYEDMVEIESQIKEKTKSDPMYKGTYNGIEKLFEILITLDPAPSAEAFNFTFAMFSILRAEGKSVEDSIRSALLFLRSEYE